MPSSLQFSFSLIPKQFLIPGLIPKPQIMLKEGKMEWMKLQLLDTKFFLSFFFLWSSEKFEI